MTGDRQPTARDYHEESAARYRARLEANRKQERQLSRIRLLLFLAGLVFLTLAASSEAWSVAGYTALAVVVVLFLVAARRQEVAAEDRLRAGRLLKWHERALARMDRNWQKLPQTEYTVPEEHVHLANDLDLFGSGSLFQLIDATWTDLGRQRLAQWLLEPAEPDEARRRYAALAEMAADRALREELYDRGASLSRSLADPARFVEWATSPCWHTTHPRLAYIIPLSTLAILIGTVGAVATQLAPFAAIAVAALLLHAVILLGWGAGVVAIFNRVQSRYQEVGQYRGLFALMDEAAQRHPGLGRWLSADETATFRSSHEAWRKLERIVTLSALRHAGLLGIIHMILQPTVLWDFHVLRLLDNWKREYGSAVTAWFDELAALEALASLSVLRDDHPDWAQADHDPDSDCWVGTAVGHPLIRDDQRVCNDVVVGPPGTVLLVTGSNMSGKSTLLRSIGINTVLAQAGAPVCASSLRLPPTRIATSMRIQDSLEAGVSFYLAELKRLKQIVDLASDASALRGRKLLYLLDEILQGTNSKERHIAVAHVVAHLIEQRAIGAISTHDLELASSPLLADAVRPVHFRESFRDGSDGREMVFDYRLRQGVATTTNALKLLQMVGLKGEESRGRTGDGSDRSAR